MRKKPILIIVLTIGLTGLLGVAAETSREEFEKQVGTELKEWEGKIGQLRAEAQKTHVYEKHHRHLKRAARHLESDIKDVKKELSKLKAATEKDMNG